MALNKILLTALASLTILSCNSGNHSHREQVKFDQYMVEGERLYQQHCSNCHQLNGEGVGKLFPPLAKSDFMEDNLNTVVCLIRNGIDGELAVNNIVYNQPMPGVTELTNLEVAEITTYIYNAWGSEEGMFGVKEVAKVMDGCE